MSETQNGNDPRQFVLTFNWAGLPGVNGCTLQAVFNRHGAAPLIAMMRWQKNERYMLDNLQLGARAQIAAFLSLPEIEPLGRAAVKAMRKTKSMCAQKKKPRFGETHAQRSRQAELWGM